MKTYLLCLLLGWFSVAAASFALCNANILTFLKEKKLVIHVYRVRLPLPFMSPRHVHYISSALCYMLWVCRLLYSGPAASLCTAPSVGVYCVANPTLQPLPSYLVGDLPGSQNRLLLP